MFLIHYSPLLESEFRKNYKKKTKSSWRMNETYVKIKGVWHFTILVKQYANTSPENEVRLSRTPATLWLHIYSFLDARSLIGLTMACKTFGVIANDPSVRNKLFCAQENQKREEHVAELIGTQAKQESRMELRERLSSAYDRPENLHRHFG